MTTVAERVWHQRALKVIGIYFGSEDRLQTRPNFYLRVAKLRNAKTTQLANCKIKNRAFSFYLEHPSSRADALYIFATTISARVFTIFYRRTIF